MYWYIITYFYIQIKLYQYIELFLYPIYLVPILTQRFHDLFWCTTCYLFMWWLLLLPSRIRPWIGYWTYVTHRHKVLYNQRGRKLVDYHIHTARPHISGFSTKLLSVNLSYVSMHHKVEISSGFTGLYYLVVNPPVYTVWYTGHKLVPS